METEKKRQPVYVIQAAAESAQKKIRLQKPAMDNLSRRLEALMSSTGSRNRKLAELRSIADAFDALMAPLTPCKKGCAHCCRIPLTITSTEAEAIAKATGRKLQKPRNSIIPITSSEESLEAFRQRDQDAFHGLPCTFLNPDTNLCSIYSERPLSCRLHHTVNPDETECDVAVPIYESVVAKIDLNGFFPVTVMMFKSDVIADIRGFFGKRES